MKNILIFSVSLLFIICGCDSSNKGSDKTAAKQAESIAVEVKKAVTAPTTVASTQTTDTPSASASEYVVDVKGAHAFINAKFLHLGYSVLWATFKEFDGSFTYDSENIENSSINITIDVASIDSNHEKRDEHMRSAKYLDTTTYPNATFNSTSISGGENGAFSVTGDLTLHGVTKSITFAAKTIGEGDDPWGGYRAGFEGNYSLTTADFGMDGFKPGTVDLELYIEGIKKK